MSNPSSTKQRKISSAAVVILILFMQGCVSYEVPTPQNKSEVIRVEKNPLTDTMTVHDTEAGRTLFRYFDNPAPEPIAIRKIDGNHWVVVFEAPTFSSNKNVEVEQIGEQEFRLALRQKK